MIPAWYRLRSAFLGYLVLWGIIVEAPQSPRQLAMTMDSVTE